MRIKGAAVAITVVGAAIVAAMLIPYWTAAALVLRAAGTQGWVGSLARADARTVRESIERVPIRTGSMRVRIFRPEGTANRATLLVSGVHPDGIDEPRLMGLARELAATGTIVATPEIEDLIQYRLTARATDTIEDAAIWMLERTEPARRRIGIIGVSFSGGLSIVAAGRASVRDRLSFVLSFGGHGNLPRVLRYLFTGVEPAAPGFASRTREPHDYALAVILHQAAELVVPPAQVAPLQAALSTFLAASAVNRTSREQAARLFDASRAQGEAMPEPARTLMKHISERNVTALGRVLLPHLDKLASDPALSPDQSTPPTARVYLLHGADDSLIPAAESVLLAEHLRHHTRVRLLLSASLTHVDLTAEPTVKDTWDMIAFWKSALAE